MLGRVKRLAHRRARRTAALTARRRPRAPAPPPRWCAPATTSVVLQPQDHLGPQHALPRRRGCVMRRHQGSIARHFDAPNGFHCDLVERPADQRDLALHQAAQGVQVRVRRLTSKTHTRATGGAACRASGTTRGAGAAGSRGGRGSAAGRRGWRRRSSQPSETAGAGGSGAAPPTWPAGRPCASCRPGPGRGRRPGRAGARRAARGRGRVAVADLHVVAADQVEHVAAGCAGPRAPRTGPGSARSARRR